MLHTTNPVIKHKAGLLNRKRFARTVLIFTERSDQLSRATDRVMAIFSREFLRLRASCPNRLPIISNWR